MYRNAYIFEVGWGEDRKPVRVLVRKDQRQSDCSATNPVLHMLSRVLLRRILVFSYLGWR